jgi:signal transduction histidine kinase/ligand-binding sensor domain-containing protein
VWLSTATGLHRLDPGEGALRHYAHDPADADSLSTSLVRSTYEDHEGTLWVGTVAGLDAFNPRTGKVTERIRLPVADSRQVKAFEDRSGVLWITYQIGDGLASWDRRTKRLSLYSFERPEPPVTERSGVEELHEDADGALWLATRADGLVRIDPNRVSAVRYRHSAINPDTISEDFLKAVFEDRDGRIWVGMGSTGLNHFERRPLPFKRYRHEPDNPQSLLTTFVMAVHADSQENIWVGGPLGLTRIDGKSGEYSFFKKPESDPANLSNTTSIVEDRSGHLWFGTYGGGLKRFDPRTRKLVSFRHNPADPNSLSHDIVYTLMVDHHGVLWVGTDNGLNRCEDRETGRFRSWKGDPADPSPTDVRAMAEGPNGVLWLVTSTLQRFDPATGQVRAYLFDPFGTQKVVRRDSPLLVKVGRRLAEDSFLTNDHSGTLWVATANGLLRFDPQSEQFTIYDQRHGLPASAINAILEDRSGDLWVATAGGLSRFNPRTETFSNYHEPDGLAGNAFEGFPAAYRSQRGQMFFGSKSGITSFWPEQIVEKRSIPPVVLTQFSLRNRPVSPASGSPLARSITYTSSLTLPYDENMFSFKFAALSYRDPQRNQYRYMLEPLESSWNPVDPNHRIATYTALPAGKYTLRVQASNNRGVWNEQGVTLSLEILPPWWGTMWFRSTCATSVLVLLWAGYQWRVRHLRHQFEMTLEARVGERTRIARELHDTLLQSFSGLMLRFQTVSLLLPEHVAEAKEKLDGGIERAAKAITEARDAVQGLRASSVERNDLAVAIRALGDELATNASVHPPSNFGVAVEGESRELHPIVRDEVYKIAAEALQNVFKHAHARRVEVEIRYDREQFRLRVRDDGRGIDAAVLGAGGIEGHYGLRGLPERAELIGGKLAVWSEVGMGTEVELRLPASTAYQTASRHSWWSRLLGLDRPAPGDGS